MWNEQKKLDHEKVHTTELYILWNEKVNFLTEAIRDNAFHSDYFLWTDMGSFRSPDLAARLTTYPDTDTVAEALGTERVFFLQVEPFVVQDRVIGVNGLPEHNFQRDIRLGGGIFGGHATAMARYDEIYYQTMDKLREDGRFIGKDQNIMSSVAVMYPDLVKLIRPEPYLNGADPWFYAQYYFSKRAWLWISEEMRHLFHFAILTIFLVEVWIICYSRVTFVKNVKTEQLWKEAMNELSNL